MSAYTRVYIECDYFNRDAPAGQKLCYAEVEGGTVAQARERAREQGWVHIRRPRSPRGGQDFCAKHKPGETTDG
jgi:hypothetical protein